ncbi:hypothetical protein CCP4SC76_210003 [Gammaproteobacteria bacterium]
MADIVFVPCDCRMPDIGDKSTFCVAGLHRIMKLTSAFPRFLTCKLSLLPLFPTLSTMFTELGDSVSLVHLPLVWSDAMGVANAPLGAFGKLASPGTQPLSSLTAFIDNPDIKNRHVRLNTNSLQLMDPTPDKFISILLLRIN